MLGRDIAYLRTKFDHCNFSCSRDTVGAHQNLNGSRDLNTDGQTDGRTNDDSIYRASIQSRGWRRHCAV